MNQFSNRVLTLVMGLTLMVPTLSMGQDWKSHPIPGPDGADGAKGLDVNGDGHVDFAVAFETDGKAGFYLNPGPARVKDSSAWEGLFFDAEGCEEATFVDLDGDGAYDIVSASQGGESLNIHWAPIEPGDYLDGSKWTKVIIPASKGTPWLNVLPIQFDGKNGMDLLAGTLKNFEGYFISPPDPRNADAWTYVPFSLPGEGKAMSMIASDMDGDGDVDMLFSRSKYGLFWMENTGSNGEDWVEHFIGPKESGYGPNPGFNFLYEADMDKDGLTDVLLSSGQGVLWWKRMAADGTQWSATHKGPIPTWPGPDGDNRSKGLAAADFNGDGKTDVVFSGPRGSSVQWAEYGSSPEDPNWTIHPLSGDMTSKWDMIELHDLDGDGDLDVVTTGEYNKVGLIWFENLMGPGITTTVLH